MFSTFPGSFTLLPKREAINRSLSGLSFIEKNHEGRSYSLQKIAEKDSM